MVHSYDLITEVENFKSNRRIGPMVAKTHPAITWKWKRQGSDTIIPTRCLYPYLCQFHLLQIHFTPISSIYFSCYCSYPSPSVI